jgi:uncharacterized OB-fold protein
MRLLTAAVLCLAVALFTACGGGDDNGGATNSPSGPSIRGEITQYTPIVTDQSTGAMRIEGDATSGLPYSRAIVRFDKDSEVLRREGNSDVKASADDLAMGQTVEVTFKGPVAETDPVQAYAGKIVILP